MQTTDTSNLFQSDAAYDKEEARKSKHARAANVGAPIQLPSKVLGMRVRGGDAWVAESGWGARRVDLKTGKTKRIYRGHGGPCTCLAIAEASASTLRPVLYTGSWDRSIKAWDLESGELLGTNPAHTDFLKCLLVIPSMFLLLSGGSDKKLNMWDIRDPASPRRVAQISRHTRPIECLVLDESAAASGTDAAGAREREAIVYSADSMGVICRWKIVQRGDEVEGTPMEELKGHQTSVADMVVGEGGLWSASVDKTVLFHPFSGTPTPPTPIPHPYYVKSLLLLPPTFYADAVLLLTGSTDESIRVWDVGPVIEGAAGTRSSGTLLGDQADGPKAIERPSIEGHSHEIVSLQCWIKETETGREPWVVSASLDGTIRRWSMQDVLNPPPLPAEPEKEETSGLTAEEEQELADLMDED